MKTDIHPDYVDCQVVCGCGEGFTTRATSPSIRIEVCSKCHPFYTGKQKLVDSAGRVEKFQKRWGKHMEERRARIAGAEAAAEPQAADEPAEGGETADAPEAVEVAEPVAEADQTAPEAQGQAQ